MPKCEAHGQVIDKNKASRDLHHGVDALPGLDCRVRAESVAVDDLNPPHPFLVKVRHIKVKIPFFCFFLEKVLFC